MTGLPLLFYTLNRVGEAGAGDITVVIVYRGEMIVEVSSRGSSRLSTGLEYYRESPRRERNTDSTRIPYLET